LAAEARRLADTTALQFMIDQKLLESWRNTKSHFEKAIRHLPNDAILECEDGSLDKYRDWLQHNELGLAFEELEALGHVNDVPREYWMALRDAAQNMKLTESVEECNRILDGYSA